MLKIGDHFFKDYGFSVLIQRGGGGRDFRIFSFCTPHLCSRKKSLDFLKTESVQLHQADKPLRFYDFFILREKRQESLTYLD